MPDVIFVAAALIYAAVAAQDLRQRRVSNLLCAAILILGLVRWTVPMQPGAAAWALGTGLALFSLGILFFTLRWLAGGDVKLIAATAVLVGASGTPDFLMLMSVLGGALALIMLLHALLRRWFGAAARQSAELAGDTTADPPGRLTAIPVPYGVAISLAAPIILFLQNQRA